MNKILKNIILSVFIIFILVLIFYLHQYFTYSLDNVSKLLNSSKLPNEFSIIKNVQSIDYTEHMEYYRKNDIMYVSQITKPHTSGVNKIDILSIYEDKTETIISNINKTISKFNNSDDFILKPLYKSNFFNSVQMHGSNDNIGIYKYCGKDIINGKRCIKVSMTSFYSDYVSVEYYYIDLSNNLIVKYLLYTGTSIDDMQKIKQINIDYNFNSVNDNYLQKFNLDSYTDYTYNEI
ncbi:MAG: hypothetical protein IJW20_01565 [Clostridia bacterium]|nr:hypothetical protein [Clostridia bacterium]